MAADGLVLESKDLFVNEATLTGESYPVEKSSGILSPETPLCKRSNTVFMGTYVISGSGKILVISTGINSEIGKFQSVSNGNHLRQNLKVELENLGSF
ncbi:MAG TPA: hypothetical protein VF884_06945 [Nitrososphaeraceae archaeon]